MYFLFESKTILLTYWRFRLYRDHCFGEAPPLNFRDLNVTGNDVYATEFDGPWLRRFQVVDEAGRPAQCGAPIGKCS